MGLFINIKKTEEFIGPEKHVFIDDTVIWLQKWTLYRRVSQLGTVQQRHLRKILKIEWIDYINIKEVLRRADTEDIGIRLVKNHLP